MIDSELPTGAAITLTLGKNRMKPLQYLILAVLTILHVACDKPMNATESAVRKEESSNLYCGECSPSRWHPGETDDQGRLVVFETAGLSRTLESDYALVFINTGDEQHAQARYDFSSRTSGYQSFTTLSALVENIGSIPEPRVIDFYGTCGAPPFEGLPEIEVRAFFDAMKEAKVELRSGENTTICTCPCPKCK